MLKASDESPVEFLVHNEVEGRKYVAILLKLMNNLTSDARAQHFAVSRYVPSPRHLARSSGSKTILVCLCFYEVGALLSKALEF